MERGEGSKYEFDWEVLDVIIGGQSAIDSANRLRLRTPDDLSRFMECYGYDIENPIEKAELFGNFQEALNFIRRYFLQPENAEGLRLEVPRKIAELTEISQLLVMASQPLSAPGQALTALWACSIMKVMHTIAHMDKDLRSNYFADIQTQILDRFYKFVHTDERGQIYLGKEERSKEERLLDRVNLVSFDSKPKKARDSVILKLLHKPENVAEDIFDRVGIRFVTEDQFDALRVVQFLKDRYVIMPANIKPSRSRNTMIDVKRFSFELERLTGQGEAGPLSDAEFRARLMEACGSGVSASDALPGDKEAENPHTSKHYRALHFTCRQLIKIKNPLYDDLKTLKGFLKNMPKSASLPDEVSRTAERLDLKNIQKEIRFFYPFEVQVYDRKSHEDNLAGRSSHSSYKKSQIHAALRRVMGELSRFSSIGEIAPGREQF